MKKNIKNLLFAFIPIFIFTVLSAVLFSPEIKAATQAPSAPEALTASVDTSDNSVCLTWKYDMSVNPYIDGFMIYRATSKDGQYVYLDDIYSHSSVNYTLYDDLEAGVTYYYKIYAYVEDYETWQYITGPEIISNVVQIPLAIPVLQSVTAAPSHSMLIQWSPVSYADGYYIYRSTSAGSGYTCIYTYNAGSGSLSLSSWDFDDTLSFTDKNLTVGKTYYYKICPFVNYNNQIFSGSFSNVKSDIARINCPAIKKAVSKKKATNTLTWKKVSEADGYIVYFAKKPDGKYKKLKKLKGNTNRTYTHKKLKNGVAYYYKVYAYKNINGKAVLSTEPEGYEKYCDYYSYADESYESRRQRIFGNKTLTKYKSDKQARKNMKTITIKVWDINSSGKKYTRKFTLTVHKNIASSMKQMFKEIYNSKEKFPIHDIGCYSWRGKDSTSEHCIGVALDINANENYMIQDGKILSGSFWKPKKNKYSIPLKCELVTILEKYGFSRGFWGTRKDYMHFSYFGT